MPSYFVVKEAFNMYDVLWHTCLNNMMMMMIIIIIKVVVRPVLSTQCVSRSDIHDNSVSVDPFKPEIDHCHVGILAGSFNRVLKQQPQTTNWYAEVGLWCSKLPLGPARVLSVAHRTRAIDRFSCLCHLPTRALANHNAASHLRQSGRLSGHHG